MIFKVLDLDGSARMGNGKWYLPKGKRPGKWMPKIEGELIACQNGYHLCRDEQVLCWLGPALFEAEYRGEMLDHEDKIVVREARLLRRFDRWDERNARLFAADCAEHVLPIFEKKYPKDDRPRKAIEAAREFARGEIDADAAGAAGDAAWDAAWAAARAAGDAAWDAAWAARDAAWAAARAAAGDAGTAAGDARNAAWDAERQWQYVKLCEYLEIER